MPIKSIAKIAASIVAVSLAFTANANAGGCHGGGSGGQIYRSTPSASYQNELRAKKAAEARAIAAAKRQKQIEIAQARAAAAKKARAVAVAEANAAEKAQETKNEAVAEVVETPETSNGEIAVAATGKTCSKFIPQTGTTVEVECVTQ